MAVPLTGKIQTEETGIQIYICAIPSQLSTSATLLQHELTQIVLTTALDRRVVHPSPFQKQQDVKMKLTSLPETTV